MRLRVNGEDYHTERETLIALLDELRVTPERVAVEVNLKVIRRADYTVQRLNEGDVVEIVNFVGGGEGCCLRARGKAFQHHCPARIRFLSADKG